MPAKEIVPIKKELNYLGITNPANVFWNLSPKKLTEETINKKQGTIASSGALAIDTGEFTGRSPKDKFIVCDSKTEKTIWWGDINIKFTPENFEKLQARITAYINGKDIYARDCFACADPKYRVNVRVITEYPWSNMFAYNMFIRPSEDDLKNFNPEWNVICAPGFMADPKQDGTRQHNFAAINFTTKTAIIGGTGYTGEIKKGIFTVLNYILPQERNTLSMHCSANVGKKGDTAVFFGLSGTGKTTLSADPERALIGDDEHGWADGSVFNFEGGCYAKTIDLTKEKEPQIWNAIKAGAILENIVYFENSNDVDFFSKKKTENTRVSYPTYHIENALEPSVGGEPKNIFFLTADAFGVLPPISKLSIDQAMYHFISGYTAKVAGTEMGVTEPQSTFSACFGRAFLPLHPGKYADLLGEKLKKGNVNVWLLNTGWTGGSYGVGERIKLKFTRAMISAALSGELNNAEYETLPVFNLQMPKSCPNVPSEILNPKNTWQDKAGYNQVLLKLANQFASNFEQYESGCTEAIIKAGPQVNVQA
jgi:phosphoenolpyruvate carboxykinase (ATP)